MKPEEILNAASGLKRADSIFRIRHIRTGRHYFLLGKTKVKTEGSWHDAVTYTPVCPDVEFTTYTRLAGDFEGFEPV